MVEPVIYKAKEPIRLNTLSGLVDYIKSNIDGFDDLILHVVDEKLVELKGKLQPNGDRELAVATAIVPEFNFDSYMDIESFNIACQSQFVKTDDRDILLKVVGNLKEDNVRSTGDDGISQAVTIIKSGIATAENIKVPNPVILHHIEHSLKLSNQKASSSFRMQSGPRGAIFEGDGGLWRVEAIKTIAKFLEKRLEGTGVVLLA